jgi:hypothetical protein
MSEICFLKKFNNLVVLRLVFCDRNMIPLGPIPFFFDGYRSSLTGRGVKPTTNLLLVLS